MAVSHVAPGIANWLVTGGHCKGMVNQRWVEAEDHPVQVLHLHDTPLATVRARWREVVPALV